ncbi:MBL fold metallo-hydrolase, partial [Streptomyces cyaneofuscatus]
MSSPEAGVAVRDTTTTPSPSGVPGTAKAQEEGPTDLRLVPPALAVWAAAALALGLPGRWVAVGTAVCAAVALALLAAASAAGSRRAAMPSGSGRAASPAGGSRAAAPAGRKRAVAAGAVLLCA